MSPGSNRSATVEAIGDELRRLISARGSAVIVLDGMLPESFFAALAAEREIDWTQVIVFLAGEYLGVEAEADDSLRRRVVEHLLVRVPIVEFHAPRGEAANPRAAAANYARLLARKVPDLAVVSSQSGSLAAEAGEELAAIFEVEGRRFVGLTAAALGRIPLLIRM